MSEWFKPKIKNENLHTKFKLLLNVQYTSERKLLGSWIEVFKIKDGLDKTIKQFQETFHSVFWEVYLNKVFLESKYEISDIVSPDFCLLKNDKKIFIEAVIANIAENEPKENKRTLDDIYGTDNDYYKILDESITRLYNIFNNKQERYHNHYSNTKDIHDSPFILAIGDFSQINYGQAYYYPLLALLYGAYYDGDNKRKDLKIMCQDSFGKEYKWIETHKKKNGSDLEIGIFNSEKYEHVSAIIYSCTVTLGKLSSLSENHEPFPKCIVLDKEYNGFTMRRVRYSGSQSDETIYDGLIVYHNPNAKNKLPDDFLNDEGVTHIRYDKDEYEEGISITNSSNYILKRRQVCMGGTESELIENFEKIKFHPVKIK